MAVYFKYKSAKDYDSFPIVDPFISAGNLKLKIFESKRYGKGKDFDLAIINSQTNEEYVDQNALIPKNTSVLIRRLPGLPRLPIVIPSLTEPNQVCEEEAHSVQVKAGSIYSLDFEWDDFGDDVYATPKKLPVQSGNNAVPSTPTSSINGEETKIKNLIDAPDFRQSSNGYGFGCKKPPSGYVCHRCNVPGHYIQHCPTNGDPNHNIKRVKLMATPSGSVGVFKPNEVKFSKEVEGLSSSSSTCSSSKRSFRDIPPELHCPLCKGLMKDAVIASKCCFSSFCDKCIRDHIMCNSICVCGARNILADALLPNITLRVTINRILESNSNSSTVTSEHGVGAQNMASACNTSALKTVEEYPQVIVEQKPTAGEAVKMKKRKRPCDVVAVNMQWGVAQKQVVAESYMLTRGGPMGGLQGAVSFNRNLAAI
ncbi:E3 ubiquitin ligase PARAQUAT TOLERANCE 3-like [Lycium barbarum]|uniref:E3 ubiquitin ligase PARAQUAT TOLERANCE 3-like n=1 Tax=Lycium barbarum TaxID=112863 RepID=UPI00293E2A2C|nr:E3 ubiquitin ligase PARAQUAT TOLERANCE 3-like [Lycium barbarum]